MLILLLAITSKRTLLGKHLDRFMLNASNYEQEVHQLSLVQIITVFSSTLRDRKQQFLLIVATLLVLCYGPLSTALFLMFNIVSLVSVYFCCYEIWPEIGNFLSVTEPIQHQLYSAVFDTNRTILLFARHAEGCS